MKNDTTPIEGCPAPEKDIKPLNPQDMVFEALLNGTPPHQIWSYSEKQGWGLTREQFDTAIADAIATMSGRTVDRDVELGRAIERLHRLYFFSMKIQDFKAALAVQKEINVLAGLKSKTLSKEREAKERNAGARK